MIVVDTSFLISLLSRNDSNHKSALIDLRKAEEDSEIIITNNFVIAELITLAKLKLKQHSVSIFKFVEDIINRKVNLFFYKPSTEEDFFKIINLSMSKSTSKLSFTDCSLVITAKEYKSYSILTYDKDLLKFIKTR
jgi:predicted nucleic acid-binding protein